MIVKRFLTFFSSIKLSVVLLSLLFLLVLMTTIGQVELGIYEAKKLFFEGIFVTVHPTWSPIAIPVFPSGFLIGVLLSINLMVAHFYRFKFTLKKSGIWLIHFGLIVLIVGSGYISFVAKETQLSLEEGQTKFYTQSIRKIELAISEENGDLETVWSIPESKLKHNEIITINELPFQIRPKAFFPNAALNLIKDNTLTSPVTFPNASGIGQHLNITPKKKDYSGNIQNQTTVLMEFFTPEKSLGDYVASVGLGVDQVIKAGERTFTFKLRPERTYTPYSITLLDFSHDKYEGTEIPKNFSSLVRVDNPQTGEHREELIYMNHPLRYEGKTYYQASFGKEDTLSILQVVENPGWLLPYFSSLIMCIGLCIHCGIMLVGYLRKTNAKNT